MLHRSFWTAHRFAGIFLIVGCLAFLAAASLTPRDDQGNYIYDLSPQAALIATFRHWSTWHWGLILFDVAIVVMLLGFFLLTTVLRDAGDRVFSRIGLLAWQLAIVFFLISTAFDLSIGFWAAQQTVNTHTIPDLYTQLGTWSDMLFEIFTPLAFFATLMYGVAIIATALLPRWSGWLWLVYSFAGIVFFALAGDIPPFVHHLLPIVIGILLLLPRSRSNRHTAREQAFTLTTRLIPEAPKVHQP